jgi:hypothetical protein
LLPKSRRGEGRQSPPDWPSRISDSPLNSAIRKLTSRASIASASAAAEHIDRPDRLAASTAASNEVKFKAASNEVKFKRECRAPTHPPHLTRPFANTESSTPVPNGRYARRRPQTLNRIAPFPQTTVGTAADLSFSIFRSQRLFDADRKERRWRRRREVACCRWLLEGGA